jgi:hypothetical protein
LALTFLRALVLRLIPQTVFSHRLRPASPFGQARRQGANSTLLYDACP